jgi:uncharacterized protein (TIGR02145 family)
MMKNLKIIANKLMIWTLVLLISTSCEKDSETDNIPVLTTGAITSINATYALSGGVITSDMGSTVTTRGVCWGTDQNPTINNNKTTDGDGAGTFTSELTSLLPNTTYYVRAYATNSSGTGYGGMISFTTQDGMVDADGNGYNIVTIGSQTWTVENLKTTKFNDGTPIPLVTESAAWSNSTSPGYCWYDNDEEANKNTYGAIYNWYTVNTLDICPDGWHVPSDTEWAVLIDFLGGVSIAGGKLKESGNLHWENPNTGATNEFNFSALPAGYRSINGIFSNIKKNGYWWSSSEAGTLGGWARSVSYQNPFVIRGDDNRPTGFSVRCVKD